MADFFIAGKRYRDMGDGSNAEVVDLADRATRDLGSVDAVIAAGNLHIGQVGGSTVIALAAYTRPADTTQYAAGDQVADGTPSVLEFAVSRVAGGTGVIIHASCTDDANQAVKPNFRLYLFDTLPTIAADNAPWTPSDADMVNIIGFITFNEWEIGLATVGAGGNCVSLAPDLQIPFDATNGVIYGLTVERSTYTPVTGEGFSFKLGVLQD